MGYVSVASLSGLRVTSSSLLAVALLLLAVASPALAAPANHRRRTTTTIKRTSTSLPLSDVNMDDVMLGDDAHALLRTRQIHGHKSNQTHLTLINDQTQNYLVISDGQVKGQKAPGIRQDPPHSLLTVGKVSTGCVHKHCSVSTFITLSEVTSQMYLCVNKSGHYYSQKFASSDQATSDCWFVQLMEQNGHVAFYSASRGGKLKQPRCVPHPRHQRYRRHHPRSHRGRHRRETEGCRRWFVSMHEDGHVSRGPRSDTPDTDKWLRSTFVINWKDYHSTQQGGHRPQEAGLVPSPLPQTTAPARTTVTSPPSTPPASPPVPGKTNGKAKVEGKGQQHKRRRGRKQRKDNGNKQHGHVDTTPQPCVETFTGSCRHLTAAGSQGHKARKTPTSQLTATDLLPFIN